MFIYLESLASHCCRFDSRPVLWILSCVKDIQLAYGTLEVQLEGLLVPEIMYLGGGGYLRCCSTSKAGKSPYEIQHKTQLKNAR